jgi:hypothetical protein
MALRFAHPKERAAIEWAKAAYGRSWRKRLATPLAEEERSYPYPNLRHHCARPFGRVDWNIHTQWARRCLLRNAYMPDMAKRMAQ